MTTVNNNPIAPIQSPLTDVNGNITLPWATYFTQVNGGVSGTGVQTFLDPIPTGISIVDNPDGVTRDITLTWTYTQGSIQATGFYVGYISGTTGTITKDNSTYVSVMAQGNVTTYSYLFSGVPLSNEYRAGIAAYYIANGVSVIGNIIQPTSNPDWRVYRELTASEKYNTPVPPTNNPLPLTMEITLNPDGVNRDVKLTWSYTQGQFLCDTFYIGWEQSTTATVNNNSSYVTVDAGVRSYLFQGIPINANYRVGIAAGRNTAAGIKLGPIIQPTFNPDWRVAAGTASTANYSTNSPPTNNPVPTAIATTNNPDGTVDIKLSWTYTQDTLPADGFYIGYISGTGTLTNTNCTYIAVSPNTTSYTFLGVSQASTYRAGIAAFRSTSTGYQVGPIQQPTSSPNWIYTGVAPNITGPTTINNTGNVTFTGANLDATYGFYSAVTVNQSNSGNGITSTVTTAYNAILGRAIGNGNGVGGTATGPGYGVESQNPSNYALYVNGKMSMSNNTMVVNLNANYLNGHTDTAFLNTNGADMQIMAYSASGAATASFSGTNKPGSNTSNLWISIVIAGNTYYIPIWS